MVNEYTSGGEEAHDTNKVLVINGALFEITLVKGTTIEDIYVKLVGISVTDKEAMS